MSLLSLTIESEEHVKLLQKGLWDAADKPRQYRLIHPHVSVVSRIDVESNIGSHLKRLAEPLVGQKAESNGIVFWPSTANPAIVAIELDFDMSATQEAVCDAVEAAGGHVLVELPRPHITLMRMRDKKDWYGTDGFVSADFIDMFRGQSSGWTTTISAVRWSL